MERHDNTYLEVKDIAISSYLYASNEVQLIGKRRLPSGEVLFQFSPKTTVEQLIHLYWTLKAPTVQPKQLFNALRDLKDMIFGGQ
ncbi:hypothetical protein C5B42_00705 [Candidatus Cerribacteria bacterium 'Amazon FNV 2010 28 9']|uniref:DUF5659 domain-containing protein n=1 Tax=Candidatus Cerribacteria bacterium 'Amazon FNV 2010 28 9' TaxID=2081795 RepID=A0A317JQB0_9BACT|nr:MAG: hypothetical protein C5B42_00705 [Candidatus Cerribacteria bacterium 'Amazon FNV 2010 28 9']